jgi:heme/copper-type cytochrome/quinol oxidase subunit 2
MDILKNPIIIGLIAGALAYVYLTWTQNEQNEKYKKKHKKEKKNEDVNLLIPLVIAIIVWFIAYAYLENGTVYSTDEFNNENNVVNQVGDAYIRPHLAQKITLPLPLQVPQTKGYRFVKDVLSDTTEPKEFVMLNRGVNVPNHLPDVMIDMM